MALAKKIANNFASFRGTPSSDAEFDKCDLGAEYKNIKIIVAGAPLEVSFNGEDLHCSLPIGVHDFKDIRVSRLWIRKTGATVELYGYALEA